MTEGSDRVPSMDLAVLIVNIGLFVATATATAIAWAKSNAAAAAQVNADAAVKKATQIAEESRDALAASARALEESNEIRRQQLPLYPWSPTRVGNKIQVRNASGDRLTNITARNDQGNDISPLQEHPVAELHPNESLFFAFDKSMASQATTTLILRWQRLDSAEIFEWRATFS